MVLYQNNIYDDLPTFYQQKLELELELELELVLVLVTR